MRLAVATALLLPFALGCDGGLKPEIASTYCSTGICGTIQFRGAVPDSTEWVRVVVYPSIPTATDQLLTFAGFSDVLPLGVDSAFYSCCIAPLAPGQYGWVLVVWKKLGALNVTTAPDLLREVGAYQDPADTTRFGTVIVPGGGGIGRIDIIADFGKMRSIADFFPPAAVRAAQPPQPPRRPPGGR